MNKKLLLVPIMLCFFTMGFVDLVGIASNYVKADLALSDTVANILPSLVFFWFLFFSVPTGMLMNRIGRKNTVLLALGITIVSLLLPLSGMRFGVMLVSFSLLGIGNALLQTALNPLLTNVIEGEKLASTMTFGQFIKAIASFLAPYIAMWGATASIPHLGLGWRVLFPIYMLIGVIAEVLLLLSPIEREENTGASSTFADCLRLLGKPVVLLSFIGIICHVGIDVGINTTAPKIMIERLGITLNQAAFSTILYFIFRTVGSLSGAYILSRFSTRKFFLLSVFLLALAMVGMLFGSGKGVLYAAFALAGLGNSNVFSIIVSQAMLAVPGKENEVSGLMIMGLFGGTVFPLLMGLASDAVGQAGAVAVMALGVLYLGYFFTRMQTARTA